MSEPKTLLELLQRQMDTGWGASMDDPLTAEMVNAIADCDLVITAAVHRILEKDRNGAMWNDIGAWLSFGYGTADRETELGEARRLLAEAFGSARNTDLELQAQANKEAAERATKAADKARSELWAEQNKVRDLQEHIRALQMQLGETVASKIPA